MIVQFSIELHIFYVLCNLLLFLNVLKASICFIRIILKASEHWAHISYCGLRMSWVSRITFLLDIHISGYVITLTSLKLLHAFEIPRVHDHSILISKRNHEKIMDEHVNRRFQWAMESPINSFQKLASGKSDVLMSEGVKMLKLISK